MQTILSRGIESRMKGLGGNDGEDVLVARSTRVTCMAWRDGGLLVFLTPDVFFPPPLLDIAHSDERPSRLSPSSPSPLLPDNHILFSATLFAKP